MTKNEYLNAVEDILNNFEIIKEIWIELDKNGMNSELDYMEIKDGIGDVLNHLNNLVSNSPTHFDGFG